MDTNKESIINKAYELLKECIPILNRLPRSQKFTFGDRVQNRISDLLETYIEAYYAARKDKLPLLKKANLHLEILRHYLRLGFDLGLYPSSTYTHLTKKLQEIGKMTGGWIKALN